MRLVRAWLDLFRHIASLKFDTIRSSAQRAVVSSSDPSAKRNSDGMAHCLYGSIGLGAACKNESTKAAGIASTEGGAEDSTSWRFCRAEMARRVVSKDTYSLKRAFSKQIKDARDRRMAVCPVFAQHQTPVSEKDRASLI